MAFPTDKKPKRKGMKPGKFAKTTKAKGVPKLGPKLAVKKITGKPAAKLISAIKGAFPQGVVKGKKVTEKIKMGIVPNRDY